MASVSYPLHANAKVEKSHILRYSSVYQNHINYQTQVSIFKVPSVLPLISSQSLIETLISILCQIQTWLIHSHPSRASLSSIYPNKSSPIHYSHKWTWLSIPAENRNIYIILKILNMSCLVTKARDMFHLLALISFLSYYRALPFLRLYIPLHIFCPSQWSIHSML